MIRRKIETEDKEEKQERLLSRNNREIKSHKGEESLKLKTRKKSKEDY